MSFLKLISFSKLIFTELIQIIICQLLHKWFVGLNLIYIFPKQTQSILKLHFLTENQICKDEGGRSAFTLDWMNQHSSVSDALINKSIGNSVKFGWILTNLILNINILIFEIFLSFCVFFAADIQNMSNALVNQILSFEGGLIWTHIDAWKDLK